jgi:predicted phage terminase large subunit-like protein
MALAASLWPLSSGGSSTHETGGTSASPCNASVICAAAPTRPAAPTVDGAAPSVASLRVTAASLVRRLDRRADVYDIAVDEAREFFANSVLVHNCDELASWQYPDAWTQLLLGLRLGADPRVVVTTTPRPTPIVRQLISATTTHTTRGRTLDNRANLAPQFLDAIVRQYEGTRLGRQELDGEILDDNPGALWKRDLIDRVREAPQLRRIVVGVDPAVSANAQSDETGIVAAGVGFDGRFYVLDDASGRYSPDQWASRVAALYRARSADRVVVEINQGGDLVTSTLRTVDRTLPITTVHAKRGKALRAEPVAALYEQGRVSHVGALATLEDQMTAWDPASDATSPDRVDALVYALTELAGPDRSRIATESHYDF